MLEVPAHERDRDISHHKMEGNESKTVPSMMSCATKCVLDLLHSLADMIWLDALNLASQRRQSTVMMSPHVARCNIRRAMIHHTVPIRVIRNLLICKLKHQRSVALRERSAHLERKGALS